MSLLPLASSAQDIAAILHGLAAVAWPAVAFAALVLFRSELESLIRRITRGKAGPIELELDRELSELGERTEEASKSLPPTISEAEQAEEQAISNRVISEAATSPRLALVTLSAELER